MEIHMHGSMLAYTSHAFFPPLRNKSIYDNTIRVQPQDLAKDLSDV